MADWSADVWVVLSVGKWAVWWVEMLVWWAGRKVDSTAPKTVVRRVDD